jgi:5-methylcytosine-specific restriction endonuclease McrA
MLARTRYEVLRDGRRDFDREAFDADHAHLDPREAKDWLRFHLSRLAKRPPISPALRRAVYARDGHACVECGSKDRLSLDHIHPFSRGGEDTMENLRTLCLSCNSRKGDRV